MHAGHAERGRKIVAPEREAPMAKIVRRPEAGQEVWIAIDVARSTWAFNVRWGGMEQRRLSTPGSIEHLQSLVG